MTGDRTAGGICAAVRAARLEIQAPQPAITHTVTVQQLGAVGERVFDQPGRANQEGSIESDSERTREMDRVTTNAVIHLCAMPPSPPSWISRNEHGCTRAV